MIPIRAQTAPSADCIGVLVLVERNAAIDSLLIEPREDGKIITCYRTTAFSSLYGPNGVENVIWAGCFEKNNAVCG